MALLDDLNPAQREAVLAIEGPLLVLAGAGTGKTRVITHRVAHLVAQGTPAESILAVTFTNKAADQMKQRIAALLGSIGRSPGDPWVGTFHSFCARLLRREAPRAGLRRDFPIYDQEDQLAAVKLALRQLGLEERSYPPQGLLERISEAKNRGRPPEELAAEGRDQASRVAAAVYGAYEEILRQAGALDFDDLLLRAVGLLRRDAEVRRVWTERFRYLQVDEYQDINRAQYDLVRFLAGERQNLCVVGDEDQSIYSWRGAEVGNILRFQEDFPGAKTIRLEENYRSTQTILDAAGGVVAHNLRRLGKTLRATRPGGTPLRYFEAQDAAAEAEFVADEITGLLRSDSRTRVAVLYRTNFQSRSFEEALRRRDLRYRVVGGFSFYQRAEVKDALAYVRLALHPEDDIALLRVINTPPRGIGKATVDALRTCAAERRSSLWGAITAMVEAGAAGRSLAPLRTFRELIGTLHAEAASLAPAALLERILEGTGYLDLAEQQDKLENSSRGENLRELLNAVAEGTERGETLADFLDRAALTSDQDDFDERAPVTLMTLHSAKGLEFDHVFLVGLEEGLFPHSRSLASADDLEEERRLCYVGMTRAKQTLTLTRALYRRIYGNDLLESAAPSRFLVEIPSELVETAAGSLAEAGETRRYEPDLEFASRRYERHRPPGPAPRTARASGSRGDAASVLVGTRVRHPTYGVGTIIAVEEGGEDRKLTVSFPGYGLKKLLERYARLERV
jgi:ATP-dependent DNA helicase UvrD/PcrA